MATEYYLDIHELRAAKMKRPSVLQLATSYVIALAIGTKNVYQNRPVVIDLSDWQLDATRTRLDVDWDGLAKNPEFQGAYIKGGEVGDESWSANPAIYKTWKQVGVDDAIDNLARIKKWCGIYFFLNTARWVGGDLADYTNLDIGDEAKLLSNYLLGDPEIHLIMYTLKIGLPAVFPTDLKSIKNLRTKRVHAIILDLERFWKKYPIPKNPTAADIVSPVWIGEIATRTAKRLQWLMDHGYLPQLPILFYSGEWFVGQYMGPQWRTRLDPFFTIDATYYFSGPVVYTTFRDIVDSWEAKIPDSWRPLLFGKEGLIFQISGDKFCIPEVCKGRSAVDWNKVWRTLDQMHQFFPAWNDWDQTPEPPPPPPPSPVYTQMTMLKDGVRIRLAPGTQGRILGTVLKNEIYILAGKEVEKDGYPWEPVVVWISRGTDADPYGKIT
jgi:hypothetical protein